MFLLFGAFIAGILTVLAPCVLPLLPIIVGGSLASTKQKLDFRRPLIITTSLAVSLVVFTLLLKASTLLINVPQSTYTDISGGVIILLGLFILFPGIYDRMSLRFNLQGRSQKLLGTKAAQKKDWVGLVATGAALGPVFSSCSPVYAYILASVLPVDFARAIAYMIAYILGLAVVLLLIGVLGQRFIHKIGWASNPRGWFQRIIALLFITIGILIITGNNVRFETWVSAHTPFDFDSTSAKLLPATQHSALSNSGDFNVNPYYEPAFSGLTNWINSPPLTLAQLKGKVVLVDFWTYSCINCIRTIPYLEGWYNLYKNDGLVVIGISAPEFSFEHVPANVAAAVKKDGITYPVALDNNLDTWNAFQNQYWPADYLIDANGVVRREVFGEGQYAQTEDAIRTLLQNNGATLPAQHYVQGNPTVPITNAQTPETYFGLEREQAYTGGQNYQAGIQSFTAASSSDLQSGDWTLGGTWNIGQEDITAVSNSTLTIRVSARDVYMVGGATNTAAVGVSLNGQPISQTGDAGSDVANSQVTMQMSQLYHLVHEPSFNGNMLVHLTVPAGVSINTFTFGS